MRRARSLRQRGMALLMLLAVISLGASWFLVSQLNAESAGLTAVKRMRNAETLGRAKLALIGYVAQQAATSGEKNPGRLPCPEAANNIGTTDEGGAAPWVSPSTPNCSSIGRLPWRTLGLDKLTDTAGEPLWYVVGPSWRLTTSTSTLLINSNTPAGDISVDGQQVVALVIAPGAAMNVAASTGCSARNQTRATPAPSMDAANYLECFDSSTLQFVTTASSTSYNDQVVRITFDEIMPVIEAAIAQRIEREIIPALNTVFTPSSWGFSGSNPVYPYAAGPFQNPSTADYQGVSGVYEGLLPFNQTQNCDPSTDARCTTTLTPWASATPPDVTMIGGYGYFQTKTCTWQSGGEIAQCTGEFHEDNSNVSGSGMVISMTATINGVAKGLRLLDASKATIEAEDDAMTGTLTTITPTVTATLNSDGSATVTVVGTLPNIDVKGWGTYANYKIRLARSVIGDHALLSSTDATTGWFARNEWYRLLYYAVAPGHTAATLPPTCTTAVNCLSVTNVTPAGAQRAILLLGGRSVNGSSRPSAAIADYLESGNATGAFTRNTINASSVTPVAQRFNDRVVVIGSN